jgi:hypothetical protein
MSFEQVLFIFLGISIILLELVIIGKNYKSTNSKEVKKKYFFLPMTTLINLGVILLGLILKVSINSPYAIAILIGMSVGLIGDFNNVSINENTRRFIVGSLIFILSYLIYSLALLYTTGGFNLPLDVIIISGALFLYFLALKSNWDTNYLQEMGRFRVITCFYPIMLLFLLSRALLNFFESTLPLFSVIILTTGIFLIFLTDIEFSVDKFFKPVDNMIGPILYPLGQLAIALSTIVWPI